MSGLTSTKNKCSCFVARSVVFFFPCGGWDYKTHKISSRGSADHPNGRGKEPGKKYCPGSALPFLPEIFEPLSLFFFPSPANVNLRDWDNFSCPPTSTPTSRRQNPALFYSPLKEHLEEMRAPPLTASSLLRCCVIYFFFPPSQPHIIYPR